MADIQAVLSAIDVFSRAPDKASLDRANAWLQDFQHSPEAWATCNVLLLSQDTPPAAKLFAAQTFRAKVTYDLHQVDSANLSSFRDTLVNALEQYHQGSRAIIVQLCLAISGLAMQFPSWTNPVQHMIELFGRNPATVAILLQFLSVLPEEMRNHKIPITDEEHKERAAQLLSGNSKQVLELLCMYLQAPGVTAAVQSQVFECLRSWLIAGEVRAMDLVKTPLFENAFQALASDNLFDSAVDVICELIHETQELEENTAAIQLIVPQLISLKPQLTAQSGDEDKIRGYARIFSEAGETYRMLLIQHPETFFPIVEAIGECSAYPDLDIVPITFPFWDRMAQYIGSRRSSVPPVFLDAYRALLAVMIKHLYFPPDATPLVGQEADDFRAFRHVMGDTVKDCCFVLGTQSCLETAYQIITTALAQGTQSWQEIEAPLFAMRSMGARLDLTDDVTIPKIMDLIPSLPNHPRVRYCALLIVSRYSDWINLHPQYIQHLLQYISAGFENPDSDVCGAAGQALKYICQDCKKHLVDFLPQLHSFLSSTGSKLLQDDRQQIYEAIGHVISAMPIERATQSLSTFSVDILAQVHTASTKSTQLSKDELAAIADSLENLEVMLGTVKGFGEQLPVACQSTCEEAWTVLDAFLVKYGSDYEIADRVTRVLRHGIGLFGELARPILTSVVPRMSFAFEATSYPSYLWIASKVVQNYGESADNDLLGTFQEIYERSTNCVGTILQSRRPEEVPDVVEDYLRMLDALASTTPDIYFQSSAFPHAFRIAMGALTVVYTDIVFISLELFVHIFNHDCLVSPTTPKLRTYGGVIQDSVQKEGLQLLAVLLQGLVTDFPEDSLSLVVSIVRTMSQLWSSQVLSWLPLVLQQLPPAAAPQEARANFLSEVTSAINDKEYSKVKYALLSLNRASRKARERRLAGTGLGRDR